MFFLPKRLYFGQFLSKFIPNARGMPLLNAELQASPQSCSRLPFLVANHLSTINSLFSSSTTEDNRCFIHTPKFKSEFRKFSCDKWKSANFRFAATVKKNTLCQLYLLWNGKKIWNIKFLSLRNVTLQPKIFATFIINLPLQHCNDQTIVQEEITYIPKGKHVFLEYSKLCDLLLSKAITKRWSHLT